MSARGPSVFPPTADSCVDSAIHVKLCLHVSYLFLCDPSLICCAEAVQSALSPSDATALSVSVDSLCSREEVSSGSSNDTILDCSLSIFIIDKESFVNKNKELFPCKVQNKYINVSFMTNIVLSSKEPIGKYT